MFKRVKSLLLAGLMVGFMALPAFAADFGSVPGYNDLSENEKATYEKVYENYHENMKAIGTHKEGEHLRVIDAAAYVSDTDWSAFMSGVNDDAIDGLRIVDKGKDGVYNVYDVVFDKDFDDDDQDSDDVLIETVKVEINNNMVNGKGNFDGITPETGDVIALTGLAVAGIAAGGLFVSNRKKRK